MAATAQDLLDLYWDLKLPVDVVGIAAAWGALLLPLENVLPDTDLTVHQQDEISGQASHDPATGRPLILYRATEPLVRSRFTIAHELGHHVLGHTTAGICCRDTHAQRMNHDPKERAANAFAAALLMPADAIKTAVYHSKYRTVEDLAKFFVVSAESMSYRLKNLGYLD